MEITQELVKKYFIYYPETGKVERRIDAFCNAKKGTFVGWNHGSGYLVTQIKKKHVYLHRLAWIYTYGQIPKGLVIDHINGDKSDNRITNLRLATVQENSRNTALARKGSGVHLKKETKKWTAVIKTIKGVRMTLGSYETKEDALYVYNKIVPLFVQDV